MTTDQSHRPSAPKDGKTGDNGAGQKAQTTAGATGTQSGRKVTPGVWKPDFSQLSLLLIDANQFERRLLVQVCRSFDIRNIVDLPDAHEALETLKSRRFDLIFCDFELRGMAGLDFVRAVRGDTAIQDRQTPIIMLTNHTRYDEIVAARDSGITEFLAKPVSPKLLLERITHVFTQPRPFIESESYIGPSRRRRGGPWDGKDRRQGDRATDKTDD